MSVSPDVIELGDQSFVRTSDMKIKSLYINCSSATLSLHDNTTGSDYQVPTGKIFKILKILAYAGYEFGSRWIDYYEAGTSDSVSGATQIINEYVAPARADMAGGKVAILNTDINLAANKYLVAVGNNTLIYTVVHGIEMDV